MFKLTNATDTLMKQPSAPVNDETVHVVQKRSAHRFRPSRHRHHHHHHRHYPWHDPNVIPVQNPYVNPFVNTCPNCWPNSYPGSWLNTNPMGISPFQSRYRRSLYWHSTTNERVEIGSVTLINKYFPSPNIIHDYHLFSFSKIKVICRFQKFLYMMFLLC